MHGLRMTTSALVALATFAQPVFAQDTTIKLWDEFGAEPQLSAINNIAALCESKVPGLKVERTAMDMEAMNNVLSTAIQSGQGPDIFYSSPGWSTVGPLIKAGAIKDLSDGYATRGWSDTVQPWAKDYVTYNGAQWALPYEAEVQGIFFHKDIFETNGIAVPTTYDEFIDAAEKLKAAGFEAPVSTAARPAYVLGWLESSMLGATVSDAKLKEIIGQKTSWDQPEYLAAVQKIGELMTKGVIPSGVLGYNDDDMMASFYNKASPMVLTGSWIVANIDANFKDLDVGYFPIPPISGVEQRPPKAAGGGFMISATSANADMAMKFLDCLATAEAADIWLKEGQSRAPIKGTHPEAANLSALNQSISEVVNQPLSAFNLYGVLPATVNDKTWNAFQAMWAGQMTPEDVVKTKQEAWQEAIASGDAIDR